MPTTATPTAVYDVAADLLECVAERLAATPQGVPDRRCVVWGAIAWDDCECGQLVVAINQVFGSTNFPTAGRIAPAPPGDKRCGSPILVADYTVSILRCAPETSDHHPPACDLLAEAARIAAWDAWAVRVAAQCCLGEWSRVGGDPDLKIHDFVVGTQEAVGPQGMCMGSNTSVLVGLINACPPCDEGS